MLDTNLISLARFQQKLLPHDPHQKKKNPAEAGFSLKRELIT